jgi:hypothetical protein
VTEPAEQVDKYWAAGQYVVTRRRTAPVSSFVIAVLWAVVLEEGDQVSSSDAIYRW